MTTRLSRTMLLAASVLVIVTLCSAQSSDKGIARPLSTVKFEQDKNVKCLMSAVESGDYETGPSTLILKTPPKCVVPWHYHTSAEQLIVIRGSVLAEMEGMAPTVLGPGGFAMMPSQMKHEFSCKSNNECIMVASFDRATHTTWVHPNQ
jgi:anti-sigma factor ChrR (cupin superfamily)